jgi:hypothetical protein
MKIDIEKEEDGRWIAEVSDLLAFWHMEKRAKMLLPKLKLLPFA